MVQPIGGPAGKWKLKWHWDCTGPGLTQGVGASWPADGKLHLPMGLNRDDFEAGEVNCYDPACVNVKGGFCSIYGVAKKNVVEGISFDYACGAVASPAVFGPDDYWESRVKFDGLAHEGTWATAPDWPNGGEADQGEVLRYGGVNVLTSNYHSADPPHGAGAQNGGAIPGRFFDGNFHVLGSHYGVPNAAKPRATTDTYAGGRLVKSLPNGNVSAVQYLLATVMFDQWAVWKAPAMMVLDYWRVFERVG